MGRSQETFSKKEVRNRKEKKRKEKAEKKAKRKSETKKGDFTDMIAYVDEFGKLTSSPPDPDKKISIPAESIDLNNTRDNSVGSSDRMKKGVVVSFSQLKGYGFIRDLESKRNIFMHANNLEEPVSEGNIVTFETGKGTKGPVALKVKLYKEEPEKKQE